MSVRFAQVAFLMSKIEKYEAKKLQWSEQELLDRDAQTIAIDPSDGRSKAFVEVLCCVHYTTSLQLINISPFGPLYIHRLSSRARKMFLR